ncbi:VENN motif pre-toxin domain-containing protein [Rahnella sp. PD4]|uniref:VENN motif pre-toxin domain-containing protein n=1 Tax=Rahnella sp. PD4 TaxID=3368611 RepID=UPI003BA14833
MQHAGAFSGELAARYIAEYYYHATTQADIDKLSQSDRQEISLLSTLAAGVAGATAGNNLSSATTGAQAGKNAVENNALGAVIQGGKLAIQGCAEVTVCRNALVEKGMGALLGIGAAKTVLDNLSSTERDYVFSVAMSGKADLIEKLTPEQRAAYNYMVGQDQKGTAFVTPDQSGSQGASNTGNNAGVPDVGSNTTTTPIAEQNPADLAYTSEKSKYVPSPKHAAGGWGIPMDLSDSKAQEVLNNSIQGGKQKYGVSDGKIYEFQPDNVGGWHGYPVPGTEAPPKVLREFLARGDINKAEYNKMIKGK